MNQALEGLKVIEFAAFAAGPMVGKHLAEHGAQVVHVESRSHPDGFRVHYPPYKEGKPGLDRTGTFALFNDTKMSLALNLKTVRGVEIARRLVEWADVLIENFTPGVMERIGLGYATASKINSRIVYLSSCNMGQSGPKASQRGFGSQLTSQSGFTCLAGYPGGAPMLLFGPYIDFVAVGYGLIAILAALDARDRTGHGRYIDLAQYETGLQFIVPALLDYQANGEIMTHNGNRHPDAAPHGVYPCRGEDAWCAIAVFSDAEWQSLCQAAGHRDWSTDLRWNTLAARKANEDALDQMLGEWTAQYAASEVADRLVAVGVQANAVNTVADLFTDLQLAHRQIWRDLPHASLGHFHYEGPPFALSETPAATRPSPLLGEHNHQLLSEILGMSDAEIAQLTEDGVVE